MTIVHGFPKPLENITLPRFIPPTIEQLYQSVAGGRETIATSFFILYRPGSPDTSRKSVKLTRTNFAISHLGGKLLLACAKGPTFGKKSYFPKTFGSRYWRTLEPVEYITENNFRTRFLLGWPVYHTYTEKSACKIVKSNFSCVDKLNFCCNIFISTKLTENLWQIVKIIFFKLTLHCQINTDYYIPT